jgi:hypothetical protein
VKGADDELSVSVDKDSALPVHTLTIAATPKAAGGFARKVEILTDNKEHPILIVQVTAKVVAK